MRPWFDTVPPGALSPVPATDDMTKPVGVRDSQLYTSPGDVIVPTPTDADAGKIPVVQPDGSVVWQNALAPKQDIPSVITVTIPHVSWVDNRITVAVSGIDPTTQRYLCGYDNSHVGNREAYKEAGVELDDASTNALTFVCEDTPGVDLYAQLWIWKKVN